jgi:transcriptional regulator with XRE-family HTH domain
MPRPIPPNAMNYGDAIRLLREEQRMTLRELAKKVDMTPSILSDVEHGRRRTDLNDAIAEALDVDPNELRALDGRITPAMKAWLEANPDLVSFLEECRRERRGQALILKELGH